MSDRTLPIYHWKEKGVSLYLHEPQTTRSKKKFSIEKIPGKPNSADNKSSRFYFVFNHNNQELARIEYFNTVFMAESIRMIRGFVSDFNIKMPIFGTPIRFGTEFYSIGIPRYSKKDYEAMMAFVNEVVYVYTEARKQSLTSIPVRGSNVIPLPRLDERKVNDHINITIAENFFEASLSLPEGNCEILYLHGDGMEFGFERNTPEGFRSILLAKLERAVLLVDPEKVDEWKRENVEYGDLVTVSRDELDLFEAMGVGHPICWSPADCMAFFEERINSMEPG